MILIEWRCNLQMAYALHETLEVHEIAAFKAVCLTKSKTMLGLISDPDLKEILLLDVEQSTRHLQELEAILSQTPNRS
jgi:similar to spore coat protein